MVSNDSASILETLNQLTSQIVEETLPSERSTVIEYRPTERDVVARSETEMLLGEKEAGTKIIRTDTAEMYVFQGGDIADKNNYILVIAGKQPPENYTSDNPDYI